MTTSAASPPHSPPSPPPPQSASQLPPSTLYRQLTSSILSHPSSGSGSDSDSDSHSHSHSDLDDARVAAYASTLARYLRGDISKSELQSHVLSTLPPRAISLHNALVLSLLRSALSPPVLPPATANPTDPTTAPGPPTDPSPAATAPPADGDFLAATPRLDAPDYVSHPLPLPRKRRLPESADTRRARTRKEAVGLPKEDRDRIRRALLALDPESADAPDGTPAEGTGKKKKKTKRAATAAAAAAAATSAPEAAATAAAAGAPGVGGNPFTGGAASLSSSAGLAPGLDMFGDAPLHGYAYPPTPPPSAAPSPDPTLPLIATSRARHAEYMRLVHAMHICRAQGDLPAAPQLLDRMTCVMWETPGGKVDKVGPGVVDLMMFGLRTYLKEVIEGMVRVARVAEREAEVIEQAVEQHDALVLEQQRTDQPLAEQEEDMDVDAPLSPQASAPSSTASAALALLSNGDATQVQSWSARPTRTRSLSMSDGTPGGGGAAPWTAKPVAAGKKLGRPNSFTGTPASSAPIDSPPSVALHRTPSTRSVASVTPMSPPPADATSPVAAPRRPLVPRDRVLTLNHLATALALEPVLAGDARHVPDRVLAKLWHATEADEQVARWRAEMRDRVKAKEDEAAVVANGE